METGNQKLPHWLKEHLQESDLIAIEQKIQELEKTTDVEIVAMLARRSTPIYFLKWFIRLAMLSLTLFCWRFVSHWLWDSYLSESLFFIGYILLGVVVGEYLAAQAWLQRTLLTPKEKAYSVFEKAELEFYRNSIYRTKKSTGLLIFVSLHERKAVIFADKGLTAVIPNENFQTYMSGFIGHMKKQNLSKAILHVLTEIQPLLQSHFPASPHQGNELSNGVRILE